jgi:hypothetical protein
VYLNVIVEVLAVGKCDFERVDVEDFGDVSESQGS